MASLFLEDIDEEKEKFRREPGVDSRCTPELLLEFIEQVQGMSQRMPTLQEIKVRFGGLLGPFVDWMILQKRGYKPRFPGRGRHPREQKR